VGWRSVNFRELGEHVRPSESRSQITAQPHLGACVSHPLSRTTHKNEQFYSAELSSSRYSLGRILAVKLRLFSRECAAAAAGNRRLSGRGGA
jgi:hypothetical protein